MAASDSIKAFTSEETQRILHHLQQPAVFMNMTRGWPVLHWTAEHLSGCFGDKLIRFRLGRKEEINGPLFETQCSYVEAKLVHFLSWTQGLSGTDVGPFIEYPHSDYWAYADYKYIAMLFHDQPSMFEDVIDGLVCLKDGKYCSLVSLRGDINWLSIMGPVKVVDEDVKWSEFGFEGRNGKESTLWVGSEGANTPCHLDSYGCNLVLQVQGRKRWLLFPPEDTANLYPTRIPYEESSVFSQVDVLHPDLSRFPAFQGARPHVVTLQPGQVLYVPRHWWHYVESVDPITVSVNSWIELEDDDVARVGEAVTKAVVCAIKSAESDDNTDDWLNPTEEGVTSHNENIQYVNLALRACAHRRTQANLRGVEPRDARAAKRDFAGGVRGNGDPLRDCVPFSVPFGQNLLPVRRQRGDSPETRPHARDVQAKSHGSYADELAEDRGAGSDAASGTDPTSAVRRHLGTHARSPGSAQSRHLECADGTSDESRRATITTNDLLDCLLHPDVVRRVTELLLERHTGSHRTASPP